MMWFIACTYLFYTATTKAEAERIFDRVDQSECRGPYQGTQEEYVRLTAEANTRSEAAREHQKEKKEEKEQNDNQN